MLKEEVSNKVTLIPIDKTYDDLEKNLGATLNVKVITSLFYKYRFNEKLLKGGWFFKILRQRFFKEIGGVDKNLAKVYNTLYMHHRVQCLYNSLVERSKRKKKLYKIVVYITLRRSNIFVSILKNGNVLRTFSSGIFKNLVLKRDRKRSPSFFTVVKKTLYFLRFYINSKPEDVSFRVIIRGRKVFSEPLLRRFTYNKGFYEKCIGFHLLNGIPFNGCRKRKKKRLKRRRLRRRF